MTRGNSTNGALFKESTPLSRHPEEDVRTFVSKVMAVPKQKDAPAPNALIPKKLVGFNYECEKATCYCLYEKDVLSSKYNKCFDSMNTSNTGSGDVTRTTTKWGTTCYSLHIQPSNPPAPQPRKPTRKPTKKPSPTPKGQSICTRSLDYTCYKSGRPQCCSNNNGKDCPKEMTICDNHPEGMTGWNYCSYGPNYNCYKDGQPSCCAKDSMNCPRDQPKCDNKKTTEELASQRFLRSKN